METLENQERLKILFVDDEENILRALRRLFLDEEYDVFTAASGQEGLEIMELHDFAVIASDQRMPKMTGAEFLEHARRVAPDSVRIVLTGYADMNAAIDAINKGGAFRYVSKPWNDAELISTVRSAAERFRLVAENKYLTELTKKQNEELKRWSSELELDVQQQTIDLTRKNTELVDLNKRLGRNFRGFLVTISNLMELRDKAMANHSGNVAAISRKIAERMDLGDSEVENIALAAQLHDLGKIGIPDVILLKDLETLTPFEIHEYQTHSIRGQSVIDSNEVLRDAGVLIRHHHESYDGEGFPDCLKGDEIPLGSRIICVADAYDRLVNAHSVHDALERIGLLSGSQFDPKLYRLLADAAKELVSTIKSQGHRVESEIHPDALMSGMVLSRDVRSGTGVLLLPQGETLSPRKMESISRYYRLDPPKTGVYVWM